MDPARKSAASPGPLECLVMPTTDELFGGSDAHLLPTDKLALQPSRGVVALFLGKDGRVIASVTDFSTGGYGGFSLHEAQKLRAKRSLAHEVIRVLSSPLICEAIETYDAEKIMGTMCSRCDCRVETVSVGHET